MYHHNPQGSVPNTSTDQPKQLTLPYPASPDTSNSELDPHISMPHPKETSTPEEGQSDSSLHTSTATNQDQVQDHQPELRTRTRLIKPPARFRDYELN